MAYRSYEIYKPGDYFSSLPKEWLEERLQDVTAIKTSNVDKKNYDGQDPVQLCNYVDVYYNSRINSDIQFMKATASKAEIKKFKLYAGDVVITKDSEDPFDIGIPAIIEEDIKDLVCGYHLSIMEAFGDKLLGRYLYYALESETSKHQFTLVSNGVTRFGLNQNGTKNLKICVPSLEEQQKIAAFLDYKTQQIDQLIEKKKALIEKLEEKRIAVITQAVTKGLDKNAKLKPSGVEWLGDVPANWKVMKLAHVVRMKSGENITSLEISPSGTYPVYGGNGIRGFYEEFTHNGNFILIGRQGALCGNIQLVNGRFWASEHAVVVTTDRDLNLMWLSYLLYAMDLNQYSVSAAQPGLSVEMITKLKIPFPGINDQADIARLISNSEERIEKMLSLVKNAIESLEEYRSALITSAVTGKIDVREVEIPKEV